MPKILIVGAGGIGCELLKNLVLAGYDDLTVVDLDTIDLSNLNRQFLFRNRHIKQSKAIVASEVVRSLTDQEISIEAIHSNIIQDQRFDLDFYRRHDLVINCLDNLEARSHVNKMCIVSKRALVESGTAGLLGQATLHLPRVSECFDCQERSTTGPKTYPICTIRSTPSQPIHCIVWAKSYLFPLLFGSDAESMESGEGDDQAELQQLSKEAIELQQLKQLMATNTSKFTQQVFDKIFVKDIKRVASNEEMWSKPGRKCPVPIVVSKSRLQMVKEAGLDHKVWTLQENQSVFFDKCQRLAELSNKDGELFFDKDHDDAMEFVTAASNLRSMVYHIEPLQSLFDAKQMAGNIIPAIASTNAIIASFQQLLVDKYIDAKSWAQLQHDARKSYLSYSSQHWITSESLPPPSPDCSACSLSKMTYQTLVMSQDTKYTLQQVIKLVQKDMVGDLSVTRGSDILYDVDYEDNLQRDVKEFIVGESKQLVLMFMDEDEQYVPMQLFISFQPGKHKLMLKGDKIQKKLKKRKLDHDQSITKKPKVVEIEDDDDCVVVE